MSEALREAAKELDEMHGAGVYLQDGGSMEDDYAMLVTHDEAVAKRFQFHPTPSEEDEGIAGPQ